MAIPKRRDLWPVLCDSLEGQCDDIEEQLTSHGIAIQPYPNYIDVNWLLPLARRVFTEVAYDEYEYWRSLAYYCKYGEMGGIAKRTDDKSDCCPLGGKSLVFNANHGNKDSHGTCACNR